MKKDNDKEGKKKIKNKITSLFELPKEIVLNLPLVTIVGNQEVSIENYKGISHYSEILVKINTSVGILKIGGVNLKLKLITDEVITVEGNILNIEYMI